MGNPGAKRTREEGKGYRRPAKKLRKNFKKQTDYHSDSDSEAALEDGTSMSRPGFDFVPVNMKDSDDETEKKDIPNKSAKPEKKEEEELVISEANTIPLVARGQKPRPVVADKKAVAITEAPVPVLAKKTTPVAKEPVPVLAKKTESAPLKSALKPASKKPTPKEPESDSDEEVTGGEESEDDDEDDGLVENLDDLSDDDDDEMDDDEYDSETGSSVANPTKKRAKRNDPTAFANSMSKILSSKLSTSKRSDPVLSRSVDAATASKELIDQRLEAKAKRQLHAEKRQALDKGRVKDVLGLESVDVSTAHIQEQERRLKKTAQRGVIKLFNAVRAAQVKGEQARAEAKKAGVVGISQREERVSEMSKKGFLDLLAQGGKKAPAIEEA